MSGPGKKTASEFLKELAGDLDFRRQEREREREQAERDAEGALLERAVLDQLRKIGVNATSLADLVQRYAPIRREIVEVLLDALERASNEGLQESLVRALAATRDPFSGDQLTRLFDSTNSDAMRWAVANTLAEAHPSVDLRWLIERLTDPRQAKAREMLALALARCAPPEASLPVLRNVFSELPAHVAMALAEVGRSEDVTLLRERLVTAEGWARKEIEKAIRRIQRRAE